MPDSNLDNGAAELFAGKGEVRQIARQLNWAATPLGPPSEWSLAVRTVARSMFEVPFPICLWAGPEYALIYNDAYRRILAAKHPDALGQPGSLVWAEIWEELRPQFDQVVARGESFHFDDAPFVMARLQGGATENAWFSYSLSPLRDEDGSVAAVLNISPETTGRVLAERRAASERERSFQAFEQTPGFIISMRGAEHTVEFVNAAHRLAFSSDAWVGRPIREAFPDIEGQGFFEMLDQVYETGERFVAQGSPVTFRQPDETTETRYLNFVYAALRGQDNEVVGVLCEGSDVTATHVAQEALREQTAALEILNETAAATAEAHDLDRIVQAVTDAGVKLTGAQFGAFFYNVIDKAGERYTLYALSGVPREAFSDFPMPRNTQVFAPTFNGEGVVRSENITQDPRYGRNAPCSGMPQGHLPVCSYLAVPVRSREGEVLGGLFFGHSAEAKLTEVHELRVVGLAAQTAIAIDNARLFHAVQTANETLEQRVAERTQELTDAHEALRQAQKMEAVGQLTGGIAHDFNNLLMGITGSLEMIERRLAQCGVEGFDRFINGAQSSARRAASLTQRLLAFSRRQTLDPKPTDINKLIYGMEDLIRRTVGPAIEVEVVGQAGLWAARVDAAQLESALLNLAINARDAMPDGGRITIETANKWLDARGASERELMPGQYLSLCVTDTGVGIPRDVLDRIFDPFFTTKPIGEGTGLGLSMVHGFVRQSGGQVRVYTEQSKGTTMCLYLPRYIGEIDAELPPEADIADVGTGETVLVVDDEPTVRMLIVEVLSQAGYRAIEAHDGPSGLKILDSVAHIDLLITDVGLPGGMNGRQVADAARVTRPGLKVLFVTGFAENAAFGNGHLPTGMEVITKPFAMTDLATKVSDILGYRGAALNSYPAGLGA
jgi:signal transduction histidine kinase/PAS domain-containing protein